MFRRALQCTCLLIGLLLLSGPGQAQDHKYMFEKPTKRWALVVGNSDYETEAKLPGSMDDANKISEILDKSDFKVINARNVTRDDFLKKYLLPFIDKIEQDDFVVFYFSGHGFSYGGENYLVPIQPPKTVDTGESSNEVFSNFISATGVQDRIAEKNPGFLLVMLDACRNIASFIKPRAARRGQRDRRFASAQPPLGNMTVGNVSDAPPTDSPAQAAPGTPKPLEQGFAPMQPRSTNIVIGYSSGAGKPSTGSSVAGQLSVYTKAMAESLELEDTDLDEVRKNVIHDVLDRTGKVQHPWFSDGSTAEIYFRPSQTLQGQERDVWLRALATKDFKRISRFLGRHNVSRFAAAARLWLADNRERAHAGLTRISPFGPEFAWAAALDYAAPSIKLKRIEGPLAFSRVARTTSEFPNPIGLEDVVFTPSGAITQTRPAGMFAGHGEAVTTGPISGYARPDQRSRRVLAFAPYTKLDVQGFETDARNETWALVQRPGDDQSVYVAVSPTTVTAVTDIGKPLSEVKVGALPGGLKSLANTKPAVEALRKLQKAGRSIAWVSIATPAADQASTELFLARVADLAYVFEREGVSRQRISAVKEAADLQGVELRVRFFGN